LKGRGREKKREREHHAPRRPELKRKEKEKNRSGRGRKKATCSKAFFLERRSRSRRGKIGEKKKEGDAVLGPLKKKT